MESRQVPSRGRGGAEKLPPHSASGQTVQKARHDPSGGALFYGPTRGPQPLIVAKCDMKLQGSLPEKPCVSPQVFYGGRRPTRRVVGSEAFRTMEQTWESQSGGALELDDMVKLNERS